MPSNWELIKQREDFRRLEQRAKKMGDVIGTNFYERLGKKISELIKKK